MAQAKSYGEVLKRCLEKTGISQSNLAQMVGCSTSQISEYISGRSHEPTLSRAKKIADALGVPLDEMISMMSDE
jgi:transcriptional regulator with XRE-family HTH domain